MSSSIYALLNSEKLVGLAYDNQLEFKADSNNFKHSGAATWKGLPWLYGRL